MTHSRRENLAHLGWGVLLLILTFALSTAVAAQSYERTIGEHTYALAFTGDGIDYTLANRGTWTSRDLAKSVPLNPEDDRHVAWDIGILMQVLEVDPSDLVPFRTANEDSLDALIDELIGVIEFERGRSVAFQADIAQLTADLGQQIDAAENAIREREQAELDRDAALAAVAPLEAENAALRDELAEREVRDVARMQRLREALGR
jgi:hypothetical protein